MSVNRNAQLAQPYFERQADAEWQQRRLELLRPQQEQRAARRRLEAVPYVLLVVLLFCAAFAYMYLYARIGMAGREINSLQAQIDEIQTLSLRTELEIGTLSSLSRIESYAKLHLGMVYPDIKAVLYLDQQVSRTLSAELSALTEAAPEEPQEPERHPLLAAWTDLISYYFTGTALAAEK